MKKLLFTIIILSLSLLTLSCKKEDSSIDKNMLMGTWKVYSFKTTNYENGNINLVILPCQTFTFEKSSGYIITSNIKSDFNYYIEDNNIIMQTMWCEKSTWYVLKITQDSLYIEHSTLSSIVKQYLLFKD